MGSIVAKYAFYPPNPPTYDEHLRKLFWINRNSYDGSPIKVDPTDIPAVFHQCPKPNGRECTLLFTHGNAEDIGDDMQIWLRHVSHRLNLNVISYDYTGYGMNCPEQKPSEKACYRDIEIVWKHLTVVRHIPTDRIVLLGRSLGSGPTVHLASTLFKVARKQAKSGKGSQIKSANSVESSPEENHQSPIEAPAAIILQSPIASCIRVVSDTLAHLPFDMFVNVNKVHRLRCPVLIVHGTADQVVPYRHSELLWQQCGSRWKFLSIPRAGHNNIESLPPFREAFLSGIQELLDELDASMKKAGNCDPAESEKNPNTGEANTNNSNDTEQGSILNNPINRCRPGTFQKFPSLSSWAEINADYRQPQSVGVGKKNRALLRSSQRAQSHVDVLSGKDIISSGKTNQAEQTRGNENTSFNTTTNGLSFSQTISVQQNPFQAFSNGNKISPIEAPIEKINCKDKEESDTDDEYDVSTDSDDLKENPVPRTEKISLSQTWNHLGVNERTREMKKQDKCNYTNANNGVVVKKNMRSSAPNFEVSNEDSEDDDYDEEYDENEETNYESNE